MSLNRAWCRWGLWRLLAGGTADMRSFATSVRDLHRAETVTILPAIYPQGAMDKVTGLSPWRNWDTERALLAGGAFEHAPTRAYLIENVDISGPRIYRRNGRGNIGYGADKKWNRHMPPHVHLDEAALVSCYAGSRFFGPFMKDTLPLELLPDDSQHPIALRTKAYGDEPGYRALFDLPPPPLVMRGHVRRLTLYDDFGQTGHKAARYQILRDRLTASLGSSGGAGHLVYLKRGATGEARVLSNEAALERRLSALGFVTVEPAALDPQEVARLTHGSRLVVSVEGSHMSHTVYSMDPAGAFLVLQPPDRFALAFKEFCDRVGITFAFVVGEQTDQGFDVNLDELCMMIERLS